ncbi:MAG: helix-hairpin-helix domain-containing protein [Ginsengibacter sp.]
MSNKEISNQFGLLSKLMDIHGENPFRAKSYSIVGYKISQLNVELNTLSEKEIFKQSGIGETMGKQIIEILSTGSMQTLTDLIKDTPPGILEIMKIKGIGPKKINQIWKDMEIESVGELLYACNENRLLLYKGFGKKTQDNVIASIEYYLSHQGSFLYAQLEPVANQLFSLLKTLFIPKNVFITGDFARQEETADVLEFVIQESKENIRKQLGQFPEFVFLEDEEIESLKIKYAEKINVNLHCATQQNVQTIVFEKTGTSEFIEHFNQAFPNLNFESISNEPEIFQKAGIQYIPPFLRETKEIISLAKENKIPELIQPNDIKGIIHCHSNWSDGSNTLEDLVQACIQAGKEYLVISDHSRSATYAQGLSEERILLQQESIDEINKKFATFKIFKSIESDILNDGNLDYTNEILSTFDLVIASVHSNLKMNEDKAMTRLIKAIENPFTTILGHMTGRLLLSRPGYPLDYKKIIDACASNNVVIEINANPRRLDMRWQWIPYALSKNVLLSINPDAHSIPEFDNTKYGVLVAQKAMVTAKDNLSSYGLKQFEEFLTKRK